jgi:hypothetical protein
MFFRETSLGDLKGMDHKALVLTGLLFVSVASIIFALLYLAPIRNASDTFLRLVLEARAFGPGPSMLIGAALGVLASYQIIAMSPAAMSAANAPFRWLSRQMRALGSLPGEFVTYLVRRRGWSLLQATLMGMEGYPSELPRIERYPFWEGFATYEDMPIGAQQRAVERRKHWLARHSGAVSDTFSQVAVNAANIGALLEAVANDAALVHGAYYTDEECIERIARWIAGKS